MTFLSVQSFDENGEIPIVVKQRKILENGEVQEDGSIKGQARIKNEYDNLTRDDLQPVGNLAAAESFVLEEGRVFWGSSRPPLNHIPSDCHLAHRISMASKAIGNKTRRGWGNTVICHPSLVDAVNQCWDKTKTVKIFIDEDNEVEQEQPYFTEPLTVIEHDFAPDDSVLVMYRGERDDDQPIIYVDGEGLLINNKLTAAENYGSFVRI